MTCHYSGAIRHSRQDTGLRTVQQSRTVDNDPIGPLAQLCQNSGQALFEQGDGIIYGCSACQERDTGNVGTLDSSLQISSTCRFEQAAQTKAVRRQAKGEIGRGLTQVAIDYQH